MVFFLVIIAVVLALITVGRSFQNDPLDYELTFIFDNLERNLEIDSNAPDFLVNYRVHYDELQDFESFIGGGSIDDYTVGYVQGGHGIGLEAGVYDTCLFVQDASGPILINGKQAIGMLKSDSCHSKLVANENPCEDYDQSLTLFRPVLLDRGSALSNEVVQLNVVLCRI